MSNNLLAFGMIAGLLAPGVIAAWRGTEHWGWVWVFTPIMSWSGVGWFFVMYYALRAPSAYQREAAAQRRRAPPPPPVQHVAYIVAQHVHFAAPGAQVTVQQQGLRADPGARWIRT